MNTHHWIAIAAGTRIFEKPPAPAPSPAMRRGLRDNAIAHPVAVTPPGDGPERALYRKRSIHIRYDSTAIEVKGQAVAQERARYLAQNRPLKIKLQGHADERGSREYNLALGHKRAEAVGRTMTVAGDDKNQIETVSFGEEYPAAGGRDESAWVQNRRVDIEYPGD